MVDRPPQQWDVFSFVFPCVFGGCFFRSPNALRFVPEGLFFFARRTRKLLFAPPCRGPSVRTFCGCDPSPPLSGPLKLSPPFSFPFRSRKQVDTNGPPFQPSLLLQPPVEVPTLVVASLFFSPLPIVKVFLKFSGRCLPPLRETVQPIRFFPLCADILPPACMKVSTPATPPHGRLTGFPTCFLPACLI